MERWLDTHRTAAGWAAFVGTLLLVGLTLTDQGITWDEPVYFGSSQLQVGWVRMFLTEGPAAALDRDTVFGMWDWDHGHNPHPPVYKNAMALTWWATRGVLGELAAYRLAPALLFAGLIALAFRWAAAAWGGIGGLGAALSILLMPQLFGHAHLGATETPLMAFWMATSAAGWWAIESRRRLGWILAGVAYGLAAGTKFTGLLAIVPLAIWGLWRDPRVTVRWVPVVVLIGAAVCFALNPMLWVDPIFFSKQWVGESLNRANVPIATYYLGRVYRFSLPWHHVFVMTAAVTPIGILALAGAGAITGLRRDDPLVGLCALTVGFVWLTMLMPRAPHHDGVRMFISLFPFLGLLAGYGLAQAWRAVRGRARGAILALAFVPPAVQLAWIHPYELAYYSEAVGGVRGAHRLGFETTYWMDTFTGPVLDWMNREIPRGARVHVFGSELPLEFQQAYGRLRNDLELTMEREEAEWWLVHMRQGFMSPELFAFVQRARPEFRLELQGVPLVAIYRVEPLNGRQDESRGNE